MPNKRMGSVHHQLVYLVSQTATNLLPQDDSKLQRVAVHGYLCETSVCNFYLYVAQSLVASKLETMELSEAFKTAVRPGTLVKTPLGSVGFVREVSINQDKVTYAITWLNTVTSDTTKIAWWSGNDLQVASGGNLFDILAKAICHPMGNNAGLAEKLMKRGDQGTICLSGGMADTEDLKGNYSLSSKSHD